MAAFFRRAQIFIRHWLMLGFAIDPVIHDITPDSSI